MLLLLNFQQDEIYLDDEIIDVLGHFRYMNKIVLQSCTWLWKPFKDTGSQFSTAYLSRGCMELKKNFLVASTSQKILEIACEMKILGSLCAIFLPLLCSIQNFLKFFSNKIHPNFFWFLQNLASTIWKFQCNFFIQFLITIYSFHGFFNITYRVFHFGQCSIIKQKWALLKVLNKILVSPWKYWQRKSNWIV